MMKISQDKKFKTKFYRKIDIQIYNVRIILQYILFLLHIYVPYYNI